MLQLHTSNAAASHSRKPRRVAAEPAMGAAERGAVRPPGSHSARAWRCWERSGSNLRLLAGRASSAALMPQSQQ
eukprot:127980-Chlamydomonas_euryale.AAC.2